MDSEKTRRQAELESKFWTGADWEDHDGFRNASGRVLLTCMNGSARRTAGDGAGAAGAGPTTEAACPAAAAAPAGARGHAAQ